MKIFLLILFNHKKDFYLNYFLSIIIDKKIDFIFCFNKERFVSYTIKRSLHLTTHYSKNLFIKRRET